MPQSFLSRLESAVGRYRAEVASPRERLSAMREAVEETGVKGLLLHPWHRGQDLRRVTA